MTAEQEAVAAVLAEARAEALEERPLACAALNSVAARLADRWFPAGSDERKHFLLVANYRGLADGSTVFGSLP